MPSGSTHGTRRAAPQQRQRERLRADLRDLVISGCCAAGVALTLPWALSYEPGRKTGASGADALANSLFPVLLRCGVGVALGGLVGVVLCLTIPGLKRRNP
jgi:hypothetical protein